MNPFNLFRPRPDSGGWFLVGLTTAFPDVGEDENNLSHPRLCTNTEVRPGCKVLHVPEEDVSQRSEVSVEADAQLEEAEVGDALKDQVLVFQYKGKFHAIDNKCPHSSFPLSQGTPFDIEDFGVVLSAGVMCPKHNWSFDLFTGISDRARYKLKVWEVQLRDVGAKPPTAADKADRNWDGTEKEVWVRRKPRMG
ncbi:Rieske domain-containing protein-like protein [Hapsidospora chrysogenum ATCC 11550]|uniref:Rieske domain-containing protein-like protein n=1 Tax=Hapsidospora chrysogenum (strain ATCC 11550 / CBS 779.69 / DSM 880 / IAM 14645 / JCM 23072 / IMI 49137) TaxID=857340 RepID=A0A086T8C3_HAPC1|nr:Rieske domain-containing protein-like protein [Hapsidospora chrysogenum ATCC 11550]